MLGMLMPPKKAESKDAKRNTASVQIDKDLARMVAVVAPPLDTAHHSATIHSCDAKSISLTATGCRDGLPRPASRVG